MQIFANKFAVIKVLKYYGFVKNEVMKNIQNYEAEKIYNCVKIVDL